MTGAPRPFISRDCGEGDAGRSWANSGERRFGASDSKRGGVRFLCVVTRVGGRKRSNRQRRGDRQKNCSRCHAIGKEGNSPHPEAPRFRTLSSRYPIEDLSESLAEGIVSGHPDMPIFVFSPADVEAIIEYLNSIQEKPAPKPTGQ